LADFGFFSSAENYWSYASLLRAFLCSGENPDTITVRARARERLELIAVFVTMGGGSASAHAGTSLWEACVAENIPGPGNDADGTSVPYCADLDRILKAVKN
jgi:hypothetical protein